MAFVGDLKWRQHFDYAISRIRLHDNIPDGILSNAIIPNTPIYLMPKYPMPIYPIIIITLITLMLTLIKNAHFMFKGELVKPNCAYKEPSETK